MFGLFSSKDDQVKVIDKVWMTSSAKWNACAAMANADQACTFVAWFPQTASHLANFISPSRILHADHLANEPHNHEGLVIFAEHYPLSSVEQPVFKRLRMTEVPVLSALDEPFFQKFGGDKTIDLMKRMGMKEDEMIGHSLITKSIRNAQDKIAQKVMVEIKATSQHEWFAVNFK